MRFILLLMMAIVFITPFSWARYSPKCGSQLKAFKGTDNKVLRSETIIKVGDQDLLTIPEKKAMRLYRRWLSNFGDQKADVMVTTTQNFSGKTFVGTKVFLKVGDETGTTFFINEKDRILMWYINNQSTEWHWTCEGV